jgi:hypothetical protein
MSQDQHGREQDGPKPGRETGTHPRHESAREHVHRALEDAARPEPDRESQQRNAGVAIAVLAVVVVLLLLAIVSGATDAFQP